MSAITRLHGEGEGTRSYLDARMWYSNADNHKKYGMLTTQTNLTPSGYISAQFWDHAMDDTTHSNVLSKQWLYANTSVSGAGDKARAGVKVCLDIPLRTDPCSGSTYTASTNY